MPSSKCLIQNELDGIFEYFSSHNTLFRHFRLNGVLFLYYGTQFCIFIGLCMCACVHTYAGVGVLLSTHVNAMWGCMLVFLCVYMCLCMFLVFSLLLFFLNSYLFAC